MTIPRLPKTLTAATLAALLPLTAAAQSPDPACKMNEYAMGLRWQQASGEVAALQLQAYALARTRLDAALADAKAKGEPPAKLAVVTDLDETVIDNSALLVRDMTACHDYTTWDTWKDWERHGAPPLIPGAKAFFDYAESQGVAIYYISDRYEETKEATLATLTGLGLPQVSADHVLLYGPSKKERRAVVEKDHRIVLLLGDTLHDFAHEFKGDDAAPQRKLVLEQADRFGADYIVFPNATYGDWSASPLTGWDAPLKTEN